MFFFFILHPKMPLMRHFLTIFLIFMHFYRIKGKRRVAPRKRRIDGLLYLIKKNDIKNNIECNCAISAMSIHYYQPTYKQAYR